MGGGRLFYISHFKGGADAPPLEPSFARSELCGPLGGARGAERKGQLPQSTQSVDCPLIEGACLPHRGRCHRAAMTEGVLPGGSSGGNKIPERPCGGIFLSRPVTDHAERAPQVGCPFGNRKIVFYLVPSYTATAQATVAPTMGLLPMPMRPIISTWAGTEEEPANWASPCIRPMESVRP